MALPLDSIMHKADNTRKYVHNQVYPCKMGTMKPEAEAGQIALKEERHQYILELLGSEGRVLAADLSSRYRVSEDTIRRDLRELASSGKIQRVHGGALPRRAETVRRRLLPTAHRLRWRWRIIRS